MRMISGREKGKKWHIPFTKRRNIYCRAVPDERKRIMMMTMMIENKQQKQQEKKKKKMTATTMMMMIDSELLLLLTWRSTESNTNKESNRSGKYVIYIEGTNQDEDDKRKREGKEVTHSFYKKEKYVLSYRTWLGTVHTPYPWRGNRYSIGERRRRYSGIITFVWVSSDNHYSLHCIQYW